MKVLHLILFLGFLEISFAGFLSSRHLSNDTKNFIMQLDFWRPRAYDLCFPYFQHPPESHKAPVSISCNDEDNRQYVRIINKNLLEDFQRRPTRMLIHGFLPDLSGLYWPYYFDEIRQAYEKYHKDEFNIVLVEWNGFTEYGRQKASKGYNLSRVYIKTHVAKIAARFLDGHLGTDKGIWKSLTIIGHSLGAHVAGFIGKRVVNGRVGSIIALEPSGKAWNFYNVSDLIIVL